jgi:F420-non-reducing hydrogenase small subunit
VKCKIFIGVIFYMFRGKLSKKVKVAIEDIAYCGGCEVAIADLGEDLLRLLQEKIELVYAPILMSSREYGPVDVAFVIGAVRNEHDLKLVKRARENSKVLVACGSCSCFGGIPSLANMYGKVELLNNAYKNAPSVVKAGVPSSNVPGLLEKVLPLSEHVKVDYYIPGCPPPPPLLKEAITTLLKRLEV